MRWTFSINLDADGEPTSIGEFLDTPLLIFNGGAISGKIRLIDHINNIVYTARTGDFSELRFHAATNQVLVIATYSASDGNTYVINLNPQDLANNTLSISGVPNSFADTIQRGSILIRG